MTGWFIISFAFNQFLHVYFLHFSLLHWAPEA